MRILLDTNILLRLSDTDHPASAEVVTALDWMDAHAIEGVIVPQVMYEYWVVATRLLEHNGLGRDTVTAATDIRDFCTLFRLLLDERGVFVQWQKLVTDYAVVGKLAHDTRLVAAMQRHGVTDILTFNKPDFVRFTGIRVFTPADVLAGQFPV